MSLHRQLTLLLVSSVLIVGTGAALGADLMVVALVGLLVVASLLVGAMASSSTPLHEVR